MESDKEYILMHHKFPFSWWDIFERYFILIAPLGICFMSFSMFVGGFKFGHIYRNNFLNSFFVTAVIGLTCGIWLTLFIWKRIESERRFKEIDLPDNVDNLVVETIVKQLGWTITSKQENEIVARTNTFSFSWGEVVTLLFDKKKLLVNTRPIGRQPFTINRDRVNYKKLLNIMNEHVS